MHYQEIPSTGHNLLKFFCMLLYRDYLYAQHKKLQEASTYYTNVEYQNWNFCCNLFLTYANYKHTRRHLTHTDKPLKI